MSLLRRASLSAVVVVMAVALSTALPSTLLGTGGAGLAANATLTEDEKVRLLHEANAAFRRANAQADDPGRARQLYEKAILAYERIISEGRVENAKLYYNLANAYLLKEDIGRAVLNYRRAERLDSRDVNIKKNLAFARSRRIDTVRIRAPRQILQTLFFWHYDLSVRLRCLLACLFVAIVFVCATVMVWRGRSAAAMGIGVVSGVLAACMVISVAVQMHRRSAIVYGVITAPEVVARQGDGQNYPESFKDPLHAGTEFDLIERRPGWLHVRLADGNDGWIPDDAAGLI